MSQASDSVDTVGEGLEFDLGSEVHCVSIEYVTEVVDSEEMTTVPNTPAHVEGVMDLRGSTTTIVDPKTLLDITEDGAGQRIIVFDTDIFTEEQSVGWVVDGVREVTNVSEDELDDSPVDDEYVEGFIARESGFVVWVKPRDFHE